MDMLSEMFAIWASVILGFTREGDVFALSDEPSAPLYVWTGGRVIALPVWAGEETITALSTRRFPVVAHLTAWKRSDGKTTQFWRNTHPETWVRETRPVTRVSVWS